MASANPFRYAGYRYDEATGLYYLMARYYDPEIGRFITRDTFHGFEDDPLSLNQYAYTKNNPVMYVDPTGHIWESIKSIGQLIKKVGATTTMWVLGILYEGLIAYFYEKPSQLYWATWWIKVVITGQAALIGSFYGPWTAGIIGTAAYIASSVIAIVIKESVNYIKNKSISRSTKSSYLARKTYYKMV